MQQKHQVHNLIILDESGSMESIKKRIIQGFNELVQTIQGIEKEFPEQEHFISMISFNALGNKILHFMDPAGKLEQINDRRYQPNAATPLYDAMGFSIQKLRHVLQDKNRENYHVLATILTDGEENASREFSGQSIRNLVEELKNENWTFTYIGAEHDVEKMAASISIDNTLVFEKDEIAMQQLFVAEKEARGRYSERIQNKKEKGADFYKKN